MEGNEDKEMLFSFNGISLYNLKRYANYHVENHWRKAALCTLSAVKIKIMKNFILDISGLEFQHFIGLPWQLCGYNLMSVDTNLSISTIDRIYYLCQY